MFVWALMLLSWKWVGRGEWALRHRTEQLQVQETEFDWQLEGSSLYFKVYLNQRVRKHQPLRTAQDFQSYYFNLYENLPAKQYLSIGLLLDIEIQGVISILREENNTVCEAIYKTDSIKKGSEHCENSVELHAFSKKGSRVGGIKNFLSSYIVCPRFSTIFVMSTHQTLIGFNLLSSECVSGPVLAMENQRRDVGSDLRRLTMVRKPGL